MFDWRGYNTWEWDFKDPTLGGGDSVYADDVNATWDAGYGWSDGSIRKRGVSDDQIVPGDARWDDRELEWLRLEPCQAPRYGAGGGTGRPFAEYLLPRKFLDWTVRAAQRVRGAFALTAIDAGPDGAADSFWDQGPVSPDLPGTPQLGRWSVSGIS